jgi:Protein of unknown function (DUF3617)
MKMLLPIAALLGVGFFQAPANPPIKMGLWESKGTFKMPQADGTTKDTSRVMRNCKTPQTWVRMMGPTAKDACPKTNEVWTKDSYSFDVMCSGKPKMASVSVQFDSPETEHGTLDMFALPDGSPKKMHQEYTEQWIGADCGDVSPDHPVLVR